MENYGSSIVGRRRNNQDRFIICEPNSDTTFLAIADGMGGMVGGEIAADLAINSAKKIIDEFFSKPVEPDILKTIMQNIYLSAQNSIRAEIDRKQNLQGMGTTLTCALIYKDQFVIGNIGDSRVYLFKNNNFQLLTKDHSFIKTITKIDQSDITVEMVNKYGHLLTKSINGGNDIPDLYPETIESEKLELGAKFLLCSDGLLFERYGKEIPVFNERMSKSKSAKEFVNNLISFAFDMGSQDNITCISSWNQQQ